MRKYIITLVAVCAFCACQKHEIELLDKPIIEQIDGNTFTYTFSAIISDNVSEVEEDGTKATVSRAGAFTWVVGDKLKFFPSEGDPANAEVTDVSGSTATITVTTGSPRSNFVSAIYPADAALSKDRISFNARGPIVVADVTSGTLTFYHIGSLINLKFYEISAMDDIKSLVFEPATAFSYDGTFTFDASHVPSLTTSGTTISKIVVPASKADNNRDITVVVPSVILSGFSAALNSAEDGSGRNIFKKSTSTSHDLAENSPVLMNMQRVAYEAPKFYYVRTKSEGASDVWNGSNIMLKVGASEYELYVNCDANTVSYIYDEYNINNDVTGAGCLTSTAKVNDANKYRINYRSDTNTASMEYKSTCYTYPYNWNNLYSSTIYLRGQFDRSNWTNTSYFSATNTTKPNHLMVSSVTITGESGGTFGIQASSEWWSANTGDSIYKAIAGDGDIYYCVLVRNSNTNESISLPKGTYTVYANILEDNYDDRPIRLMFVKQ